MPVKGEDKIGLGAVAVTAAAAGGALALLKRSQAGEVTGLEPLAAEATIAERLAAAKAWIDSLYQTDGTYGYVKEYPGFPLAIYVRNTREWRLSGDWCTRTYWSWFYGPVMQRIDASRVARVGVAPAVDMMDVRFEDAWDQDYDQPVLRADRAYAPDGRAGYLVTFMRYGGTYRADIYLGDSLLWANVGAGTPRIEASRYTSGFKGMPAHRYTVRHGARLAQFIYWIWGDSGKRDRLAKLRSDFGFTYDIYDPLFGQNAALPDQFMFTFEAYHDNYETWKRLPRGMNPHRYPYFSKVHLNLDLYIGLSRVDPLVRTLQAVHILNKYRRADYKYAAGGGPLKTPTDIARETWDKWNGVGISWHPLYPKIASAVRTSAFLGLSTLLGYRYGVTEMRGIADTVYTALTKTTPIQAGLYPYARGWLGTKEHGALLRPPYQGAFYNLWTTLSPGVAATYPSKSILEKVLDIFAMPTEDDCPIPANLESTALMLQALRIYARYALGIAYPPGTGAVLMP